ncbi:MAG: hypothetical protein KJO07_15310, partial [Deltaproteobacteria bacterium]|nr:hypothetical protein [Deltaproteobacteria bacterium]
LKKAAKKQLSKLAGETKQKEGLCHLAPEALSGGAKIGPDNLEEILIDMAGYIPKVFNALKGGKLPLDLILDIPGVTKVQYHYKGFPRGPENRHFELSGQLVMTGSGPRLKLKMGKLEGGSDKLTVEYQVNYKTDRAKFPAWSPFLKDYGVVRKSGSRTSYERKIDIIKKKIKNPQTGKKETLRYQRKHTHANSDYQDSPFATFYERGKHRNRVRVWQEYEYFWSAYKLTEPKPSVARDLLE